jgi:hypothetical protein
MNVPNTSTRNAARDSLRSVDTLLLGFLILAMCSQIDPRALTIGRDTMEEGLGYATKTLKVAVSDIALVLCFGWFLFRTTALRAWSRLWWPPFACWALIAAMTVSLLHSPHVVDAIGDAMSKASGPQGFIKAIAAKESKEAIAEVLQFAAYFIIAPMLFVNLLLDRRSGGLIERRRLALHVFSAAVLLNVLAATAQLFASNAPTPRGLFNSPNIYGVFLTLSLPLLVAMALREWTKVLPALIVTLVALLLGLLTMVSAWAVVAVLIGVIIAGVFQRLPGRTVGVLAVSLVVLFTGWTAQTKLKSNRAEVLRVSSASQKVKKQYIEWYAALGWAVPKGQELPLGVAQLHQFETGVGPGNYQQNIGPYYSSLPNEEKMPPDSNNLYLVQAVSLGVLGLGALLWVFGDFMGHAWRMMRGVTRDWLSFGVFAALCAWLIVNVFHAGIVRGGGVVLAFVLSLAVVAAQSVDDQVEERIHENI